MPTLSNLIGHGLDIIGEGGYAVAPGSTHISGNKYVFVNKNPIIQLPTKLKEKILDVEKQFLKWIILSTWTCCNIFAKF